MNWFKFSFPSKSGHSEFLERRASERKAFDNCCSFSRVRVLFLLPLVFCPLGVSLHHFFLEVVLLFPSKVLLRIAYVPYLSSVKSNLVTLICRNWCCLVSSFISIFLFLSLGFCSFIDSLVRILLSFPLELYCWHVLLISLWSRLFPIIKIEFYLNTFTITPF